jgi:hypothetical protein
MTIAGTVTEWEFSNPHPQIYFDVKTETGQIAKACTAPAAVSEAITR